MHYIPKYDNQLLAQPPARALLLQGSGRAARQLQVEKLKPTRDPDRWDKKAKRTSTSRRETPTGPRFDGGLECTVPPSHGRGSSIASIATLLKHDGPDSTRLHRISLLHITPGIPEIPGNPRKSQETSWTHGSNRSDLTGSIKSQSSSIASHHHAPTIIDPSDHVAASAPSIHPSADCSRGPAHRHRHQPEHRHRHFLRARPPAGGQPVTGDGGRSSKWRRRRCCRRGRNGPACSIACGRPAGHCPGESDCLLRLSLVRPVKWSLRWRPAGHDTIGPGWWGPPSHWPRASSERWLPSVLGSFFVVPSSKAFVGSLNLDSRRKRPEIRLPQRGVKIRHKALPCLFLSPGPNARKLVS